MDTKAPLDLHAAYAPIRAEMEELASFLETEFRIEDPFIWELLQHIASFRGKQIRPALLFLASKAVGGPVGADSVKLAAVLELIHTATLVHDDVLDDARLRRRVETVHRRWGERAAVLIGDYIYSRAFHLSTQVPGMAGLLSDVTNTICEGELLQLGHRFQWLDEGTYLEIIRKKTASLYGVACRIGGQLAGAGSETCARLAEFGMSLGMAFQIVDDCLDYDGSESLVGKSLGTDLRQGKVTLPLLILLETATSSERSSLLEILHRPLSPEQEEWIHGLVDQHGVLDEAYARAASFVRRAKDTLASILAARDAPGAVRESLDLVADFVVRRRR